LYAYAGPSEYTFLGWNGGDWTNGYPYYIKPPQGPNFVQRVMCDDYFHGGEPGQQWDANITNLGTKNLSEARFNNIAGPNALYPLRLYDEAGWILLQTEVEPMSDWKSMNYAVWTLFDHNALCDSGCTDWLNQADEAYHLGFPDTDFNRVYILTPVNQHDPDPNGMQEFLYLGQDPSSQAGGAQTTPEPGTIFLVGTGALALLRKKFVS
jgi:hypothetical protein